MATLTDVFTAMQVEMMTAYFEEQLSKLEQEDTTMWSLADFCEHSKRSRVWWSQGLFKDPQFVKRYSAKTNREHGFIFFPKSDKGGKYYFIARKARKFIENELVDWI